jgi:hypothetical protein
LYLLQFPFFILFLLPVFLSRHLFPCSLSLFKFIHPFVFICSFLSVCSRVMFSLSFLV